MGRYESRVLAMLPDESSADLETALWKFGFYRHIEIHRRSAKPVRDQLYN